MNPLPRNQIDRFQRPSHPLGCMYELLPRFGIDLIEVSDVQRGFVVDAPNSPRALLNGNV